MPSNHRTMQTAVRCRLSSCTTAEEASVPVADDKAMSRPAMDVSASTSALAPPTAAASAQTGEDTVLTKADVGRKPGLSRLSRFGQDSHAATPSTAADSKVGIDAPRDPPSAAGQHAGSAHPPAPSSASGVQPGLKLSRPGGKGLGRYSGS